MEAAVIITCLLLSAFFSGMEIAYISANKVYLGVESQQDAFISKILARLTHNPAQFIAAMLMGNTIALVVYSYHMAQVAFRWFGLQDSAYHFIWQFLMQTATATAILLVTAEFLPKVFFQVYANRLIKLLALPAYVFYKLLSPISKVFLTVADFVLVRVFHTKGELEAGLFTRGDLGNYVTQQLANDEQEEADTEVQLFKNALGFALVKARTIMTPRTELAGVEINDGLEELRQVFLDTDYSKIVVYRSSPDNVVGYVHSFELFNTPASISSITIPAEKVSGDVYIKELLTRLTLKGKSMAVVVDGNGKTEGIVTVEDIIEELFGEIEDEHDDAETLVAQQLPGGAYVFSARYDIEHLNEVYSLGLPQSNLYSSLGGFVVHLAGRVPAEGESVISGNYRLEVLQASAKYIGLVKITPQTV